MLTISNANDVAEEESAISYQLESSLSFNP